ncbi:methyltransferase domain-containing protein [Belnapia sp. T18]|uniref:Methyltransferase domain-containing protein n=1 Tax=Belnapia arida TaxID=2804533 RepID=A0ABS1UCC3_9PROT|nr:class I SAM-dependent methyltransferase [Belnapia arida]MBL6082185.1 methyltransferase domain-containing protein [Belnapia arida]
MKLADDMSDAADLARRDKVNEVWSAASVRDAQVLGQYWLAHPMVRDRVNRLASGRPDQDAYGHLMELLAARGWRLPIGHALSLGCGFGGLERDLVGRGLVARMDALDLAEGAIAEARRLAADAGLGDRIQYQVADLEAAYFAPGSADIVFAHSSVHHVERLEELFAAVKQTLRPGGVFHLYEFVGATRFQWTDAQLRLGNALLDSLPERLRRLPSGKPKGRLTRPTIEHMVGVDPTEAIRSAEILSLMREHFTILEERPLGGGLLHNVLGDIAQNFRPDDPEDRAVLERFFAAEDAAMADGTIGTDFATITATVPETPNRPSSRLTSLLLLVPPVRRLYIALRQTQAEVARLKAGQAHLSSEVARLSCIVDSLKASSTKSE